MARECNQLKVEVRRSLRVVESHFPFPLQAERTSLTTERKGERPVRSKRSSSRQEEWKSWRWCRLF